ncbi:MAG TPA: photosystem P840 reaction-center cytochrome c-551, partial [Blastocatellia bacterium]|nr:photosystem P840 reaction-center cytochrome c-551 [Blastocatellia bacterium]
WNKSPACRVWNYLEIFMLSTATSVAFGLLFVTAGGAAVWLMLASSGTARTQRTRKRMVQAHRAAGYLFIALFCVMAWLMIGKVADSPNDLPLRPMLHALLAIVLIPLLFVKVIIARYHKSYTNVLVALGLTIFTLAFVLIASTAGPYLIRKAATKNISLQSINMGAATIDVKASQQLVQTRCSQCHTLDRVVGARKDPSGWLATVNRMRSLPGSRISESDAKVILAYLLSENSVDVSSKQGELTVGRALVDSHCNRCHTLERTYQAAKSPEDWKQTVARMTGYAQSIEGFFKPGDVEKIVQYLSSTQTPEAVQARNSASQNGAQTAAAPAPNSISSESQSVFSGSRAVFVIFGAAAIFGLLLVRRPRPSTAGAKGGSSKGREGASVTETRPLARSPKKSVVLELTRIQRQTHDSSTFRFRVPQAARLQSMPGQFMTFNWLLNGQKVTRSYSICSSPTQSGYVEITVKKQESGLVSVFLNDRAQTGLTVEAHGPSGKFYFDEIEHSRIVLIAGGSGITPMISILRYIDDLCLDVDATLFFSVRSKDDVIFDEELKELETRLPRFRRVVVITRPDQHWNGPSGRLTAELLCQKPADPKACTYFLCGPPPFMDHVKSVLTGLGVAPEQILQESFGVKRQTPHEAPVVEAPEAIVNFAKSGKNCALNPAETLLEAAERSGVNIPYSCRQGQCGTCVTGLIDGEVAMDCEDGLDSELRGRRYVLTCVGHALGDVELDA